MRERTQKLMVLLMLAMVAALAVMAATGVQVSPETLELWDNDEMPAFTEVAGMQLHLTLPLPRQFPSPPPQKRSIKRPRPSVRPPLKSGSAK